MIAPGMLLPGLEDSFANVDPLAAWIWKRSWTQRLEPGTATGVLLLNPVMEACSRPNNQGRSIVRPARSAGSASSPRGPGRARDAPRSARCAPQECGDAGTIRIGKLGAGQGHCRDRLSVTVEHGPVGAQGALAPFKRSVASAESARARASSRRRRPRSNPQADGPVPVAGRSRVTRRVGLPDPSAGRPGLSRRTRSTSESDRNRRTLFRRGIHSGAVRTATWPQLLVASSSSDSVSSAKYAKRAGRSGSAPSSTRMARSTASVPDGFTNFITGGVAS